MSTASRLVNKVGDWGGMAIEEYTDANRSYVALSW
jgi:hypothetical protein